MSNFYYLSKKVEKTPQYQMEALASALGYLKNLTSKDKTSCGVAPEHREAVRLYVDTWITPTLEAVLGSMLGNDKETEWLKERVYNHYNYHIMEGTIDVVKAIESNTTTENL